jgi:hypothetical protein
MLLDGINVPNLLALDTADVSGRLSDIGLRRYLKGETFSFGGGDVQLCQFAGSTCRTVISLLHNAPSTMTS